MKSQKQAQNQGLQLGTGQGQARRVEDLVVSVEKGRDQLWGMGVSRKGVTWWMVLLTCAGQWPQGHQERSGMHLNMAGRGKGMH